MGLEQRVQVPELIYSTIHSGSAVGIVKKRGTVPNRSGQIGAPAPPKYSSELI